MALEPLDIEANTRVSDILRAMRKTAVGGRAMGEAFDVLSAMTSDDKCFRVMTISGIMTVAKMGRIVCTLIDRGFVHAVIATGALIAHGLTESIGGTHYIPRPGASDKDLFEEGYNRIYDTLEMEASLNHVEEFVSRAVRDLAAGGKTMSSEILCREIGRQLADVPGAHGILRSAFLKNVPVYIPAFTDSEVGLDVATTYLAAEAAQRATGDLPISLLAKCVANFNPFLDLVSYAQKCVAAERLGIFTIGGGVPRNWAQQIGPYLEITKKRLQIDVPMRQYTYGVRICPEPAHWGGLSGCTYTEGVSWRKFVPVSLGGRYAEVLADATIAWPLAVKAGAERFAKTPAPGKTF